MSIHHCRNQPTTNEQINDVGIVIYFALEQLRTKKIYGGVSVTPVNNAHAKNFHMHLF